jgi:hypothetical protein
VAATTSDLQETINRMKEAERTRKEELYRDGNECGRNWAMEEGTMEVFELITDAVDERKQRHEWDDVSLRDYKISHFIPDELGTPLNFVSDISARVFDHPAFIRGFIEGALDVWDEVNDQLD